MNLSGDVRLYARHRPCVRKWDSAELTPANREFMRRRAWAAPGPGEGPPTNLDVWTYRAALAYARHRGWEDDGRGAPPAGLMPPDDDPRVDVSVLGIAMLDARLAAGMN